MVTRNIFTLSYTHTQTHRDKQTTKDLFYFIRLRIWIFFYWLDILLEIPPNATKLVSTPRKSDIHKSKGESSLQGILHSRKTHRHTNTHTRKL